MREGGEGANCQSKLNTPGDCRKIAQPAVMGNSRRGSTDIRGFTAYAPIFIFSS